MTTQAVKDKGAEHSKHELIARRIVSYLVLTILCFLCLFFFYVLIINATRNHYQIQRGFSFLPGKSFMTNLNNVLATPIFRFFRALRTACSFLPFPPRSPSTSPR